MAAFIVTTDLRKTCSIPKFSSFLSLSIQWVPFMLDLTQLLHASAPLFWIPSASLIVNF